MTARQGFRELEAGEPHEEERMIRPVGEVTVLMEKDTLAEAHGMLRNREDG